MTQIVSTWFYTQGSEEGGNFAQLREDSSSEDFRDIYRRCIAVFFATARRANPAARLVLYLNRPWSTSNTAIAEEVGRLLDCLEVEQKVIPYLHEPPQSFTKSWRNQFFVIDVMDDLQEELERGDSVVILDSDVIWTSKLRAQSFWADLASCGIATYEVGYHSSKRVNGLSIVELEELAGQIGSPKTARISYCGGEIIGSTADRLQRLVREADRVWSTLMTRHEGNHSFAFEEAHVLSLAYGILGEEPGKIDRHLRRLWTQPLKPRNVTHADRHLTLWHVPAEKKYGIARIYRRLIKHGVHKFISEPDKPFLRTASRELGIPRNTSSKFLKDISKATSSRLIDKFSHKARSRSN
ncbi:hypothetical protein [Paenarthrobacter sp. 22069]|uniref:hypothetical protein n=1 Tax=Paenarthrobacter sp. 22069 TaxID=3453864 RepID=UPI003F8791C6